MQGTSHERQPGIIVPRLQGLSPPSTWIESLDDKVNPVTVRELRRLLRNWTLIPVMLFPAFVQLVTLILGVVNVSSGRAITAWLLREGWYLSAFSIPLYLYFAWQANDPSSESDFEELTPLDPGKIVLGKALSAFVLVMGAVLAGLPLLALVGLAFPDKDVEAINVLIIFGLGIGPVLFQTFMFTLFTVFSKENNPRLLLAPIALAHLAVFHGIVFDSGPLSLPDLISLPLGKWFVTAGMLQGIVLFVVWYLILGRLSMGFVAEGIGNPFYREGPRLRPFLGMGWLVSGGISLLLGLLLWDEVPIVVWVVGWIWISLGLLPWGLSEDSRRPPSHLRVEGLPWKRNLQFLWYGGGAGSFCWSAVILLVTVSIGIFLLLLFGHKVKPGSVDNDSAEIFFGGILVYFNYAVTAYSSVRSSPSISRRDTWKVFLGMGVLGWVVIPFIGLLISEGLQHHSGDFLNVFCPIGFTSSDTAWGTWVVALVWMLTNIRSAKPFFFEDWEIFLGRKKRLPPFAGKSDSEKATPSQEVLSTSSATPAQAPRRDECARKARMAQPLRAPPPVQEALDQPVTGTDQAALESCSKPAVEEEQTDLSVLPAFHPVLERLDDRLNPVLVLEIRQLARDKKLHYQFCGLVLVELIIACIPVLLYLYGSENVSSEIERTVPCVLVGILLLVTGILLPGMAFTRFQAEIDNRFLDQEHLSCMTAGRVISGKLQVVVILTLICFAACFPSILAASFLGRLGIWRVSLSLLLSFVAVFLMQEFVLLPVTLPLPMDFRKFLGGMLPFMIVFISQDSAITAIDRLLLGPVPRGFLTSTPFLVKTGLALVWAIFIGGILFLGMKTALEMRRGPSVSFLRKYLTVSWAVLGVLHCGLAIVTGKSGGMVIWTTFWAFLFILWLMIGAGEGEMPQSGSGDGVDFLRSGRKSFLKTFLGFLYCKGAASGIPWAFIHLGLTIGIGAFMNELVPVPLFPEYPGKLEGLMGTCLFFTASLLLGGRFQRARFFSFPRADQAGYFGTALFLVLAFGPFFLTGNVGEGPLAVAWFLSPLPLALPHLRPQWMFLGFVLFIATVLLSVPWFVEEFLSFSREKEPPA